MALPPPPTQENPSTDNEEAPPPLAAPPLDGVQGPPGPPTPEPVSLLRTHRTAYSPVRNSINVVHNQVIHQYNTWASMALTNEEEQYIRRSDKWCIIHKRWRGATNVIHCEGGYRCPPHRQCQLSAGEELGSPPASLGTVAAW